MRGEYRRFQLYSVFGVIDRTNATSKRKAIEYFKKAWNIERLGGNLQWSVCEGGEVYYDNYDSGVINGLKYNQRTV